MNVDVFRMINECDYVPALNLRLMVDPRLRLGTLDPLLTLISMFDMMNLIELIKIIFILINV
uniref:Uncharacterized protein n=1 Tax=viral metagenome TaxID=1070528 RepID=A0A6C0CA35_9ZZZZ